MGQFFSSYIGYMVLTGVVSVIGMIVSSTLKSKFRKYSQIAIGNGMSGREVAEAMLRYFGVNGVEIVEGQGMLTDHYNPASKTVSLSPDIYSGRTIMAAAVAAHECGHAVQHATNYSMLQLRSGLVPIVQIASGLQQYLLMAVLLFASSNPALLLFSIAAFGVTAFFSLITLPVEFDASKRALVWLNGTGLLRGKEYDGAKDALTWAAMTYVAAALAALVSLVFLILRYVSSRQ
jgi:Zn-dependent membrane protease YugP